MKEQRRTTPRTGLTGQRSRPRIRGLLVAIEAGLGSDTKDLLDIKGK